MDFLDEVIKTKNAKIDSRLIRKIVPIEQWVNDPYYTGESGKLLYPFWKNHLIKIFSRPNDQRINEIILTGSIGGGKTTFMTFCFLRLIYEISCYDNPHALYGLMPGTTILLAYLSLNREIAEATGYGDLRSLIDSVPYFKEHFPRNYRLSNDIQWPEKNLKVSAGSRISHTIGTNLIGAALDESNFGASGDAGEGIANISRAQKIYSSLRIRGEQRFSLNGIDYSLSILISSATTANSFTETRLAQTAGNPHVYHIDSVAYEVAPWKYSSEKFVVFIGNEQLDPCVVDNITSLNNILDSLHLPHVSSDIDILDYVKNLEDQHKSFFRLVPINFKRSFQTDIIKSLQDICGVSVNAIGRLFTARRYYNECIDPELIHPFIQEEFILSTGSDIKGIDYLKTDWKPLNPDRTRYVHIDQSTSFDSTGICMCHICDMKEVNGENKPVVMIDFMLRINPPLAPEKIPIAKCRELVLDITKKFNLRIGKFTYDTFASAESIQQLQQEGYNASAQSVDRSCDAYLSLCDLFYEKRIHFYNYPIFEEEFFNLQYYRNKGKIDHLPEYSKDCSDAVAGATYNALTSESVADALRKKDMLNILNWL